MEGARRMKDKTTVLVLTLVAIVFTVALTFATIELPGVLNRIVDAALGIPHYHPAIEPDLIEAFVRSNHIGVCSGWTSGCSWRICSSQKDPSGIGNLEETDPRRVGRA
jgi:hypothetical protein